MPRNNGKPRKIYSLLFVALVLGLGIYFNTPSTENVDHDRVSKSIRKFLRKNSDLSTLKASCSIESCISFEEGGDIFSFEDYLTHQKQYTLGVPTSLLMEVFTTAHPRELWNGDAQFQLSYDHRDQEINYQDDERGGVRVGELILLEVKIRITKRLSFKRPTAFEIITINPEKGLVAFSYTVGMKSKGIQIISLEEADSGTLVTHTTKYLSGNDYRDNTLYVTHHEKLLDDFYVRLEALAKNKQEMQESDLPEITSIQSVPTH